MGRIAMPSLFAQAAAPSIGAVLLETVGPAGALTVFLDCRLQCASCFLPVPDAVVLVIWNFAHAKT